MLAPRPEASRSHQVLEASLDLVEDELWGYRAARLRLEVGAARAVESIDEFLQFGVVFLHFAVGFLQSGAGLCCMLAKRRIRIPCRRMQAASVAVETCDLRCTS